MSAPTPIVQPLDACPCGSGKPFCDCHGDDEEDLEAIAEALALSVDDVRARFEGDDVDAALDLIGAYLGAGL